jgi:hypothetical protein
MRRCPVLPDSLDNTTWHGEKVCRLRSYSCREDGTIPCRTASHQSHCHHSPSGATHVIVARYHLPVANVVANAVLGLVGVNVVGHLHFLFCLLLPLVLATLSAFDVRNRLLAVFGNGDLTLWRGLPARACASRCWRLCGYYERGCGLAKDTMTTSFSRDPTFFVWLGLFALGFGCR